MNISASPSYRRCFTEPTLALDSAFEEDTTDDFVKMNTPAQVLDKLKSARDTKGASEDAWLATAEVSMVFQGELSKCLVVHLMCARRKTPLSIIEQLVFANPSALSQQESRGKRLALHICLLKGSTPDIVKYVLEQSPQAVYHADSQGNLPLHYAAMYACPQIWNLILQANPEGCKRANKKQKYPLHLMCARYFGRYDITKDQVQSCLDANPAAIQIPDAWGRLPLHLACQGHAQKDVIQVLVKVYPEALLQSDSSKEVPHDLVRRHNKDDTPFVATVKEWTVTERRKKHTGFFGFFHHHMTHHNHNHHRRRKRVQIESFRFK